MGTYKAGRSRQCREEVFNIIESKARHALILSYYNNPLHGSNCRFAGYKHNISSVHSDLAPSLCYLKVHQLGNVGVCNEHLMQQTTDEALHLSQVTEQASLWLDSFHVSPVFLLLFSLF